MQIKRTIAIILSVALVLAFTACADTRMAMTIGGVDVTGGDYIYAQFLAAHDVAAEFREANPDVEPGFDYYAQSINGKSFADSVNDRAVEILRDRAAFGQMFDELGLEFSAEDLREHRETVDNYLAGNEGLFEAGLNFNNWGDYFESVGVMPETVLRAFSADRKAYPVFEATYTSGGPEEVPETELRAHFENEYARFRVIVLSLVDPNGEPLQMDDMAIFTELAEVYAARLNAGENFAEVEAEFAEFYEKWYEAWVVENLPEELREEVFGEADGDTGGETGGDTGGDTVGGEPNETGGDVNDGETGGETNGDENRDGVNGGVETGGDETNNDETNGDETNNDETNSDETNGNETNSDEPNETIEPNETGEPNETNEPNELDETDELDEGREEPAYDVEPYEYREKRTQDANSLLTESQHAMLFAMEIDTAEVDYGEDIILVFQRLDVAERDDWFVEVRDSLIYDLRGDEFEEKLAVRAGGLVVVLNEAAIRRYRPETVCGSGLL